MKGCLEKRRKETRVCYVCGDIGIEGELLTCYLCNITTKHVYCMEKMLAIIPEQWKCEECLNNSPFAYSRTRLVSKKTSRPVKRKYLSDLVDSKLPVEGRRSPSSIQKPSSFCPEKHDTAKPGIAFGGCHAMSSCVLKNAKGYVADAEQTFSSQIKATDIKFSDTSRRLDASMARKKQAEKIRVLLHSKGKYIDDLKPSVRSCQPKEGVYLKSCTPTLLFFLELRLIFLAKRVMKFMIIRNGCPRKSYSSLSATRICGQMHLNQVLQPSMTLGYTSIPMKWKGPKKGIFVS